MSLTVQQLLADAKRLSGRLREHDQSADLLITRAQEVLKEVDAMKQYQEDVENLNEVAHNRPRAQLVLGIQQENRHIRALQQENKELRAALEEHQNALELIMSKYRQHVTRLINSTRIDKNLINNHKTKLLQARTDKVCEMAAVMKESVKLDEAASNQQQELLARLITENKGLRELLDISRKNGSSTRGRGVLKPSQDKEVQTEEKELDTVTMVTLPCPAPSKKAPPTPTPVPVSQVSHIESSPEPPETDGSCREHSSASESDETSDDDSIKFDTIKLATRRKTVVPSTLKEEEEDQEAAKETLEQVVGKERLEHETVVKERMDAKEQEVVKERMDAEEKEAVKEKMDVKKEQEAVVERVEDRLDPIKKEEEAKVELVKDRLEGSVEEVKDDPLVNHAEEGQSKVKEDSTVNHAEDRLEKVIKQDENRLENVIKKDDNSLEKENEDRLEKVIKEGENKLESVIQKHESLDKVIRKEEALDKVIKKDEALGKFIKKDETIPAEEQSIPHKIESAHLENSIDSIAKTLESFEKTIDSLENSSEDLVESCNTATATIETNASVDKVTKVEVDTPKEVTLNEVLIACEQNHKPVSIQNDNKENIIV